MSERIAEVYSLLIPLADARLLVPRACVAEVVGYQNPAPMDGAPPWYLGLVNWNARSVPLVSFECACGLPVPPTGGGGGGGGGVVLWWGGGGGRARGGPAG